MTCYSPIHGYVGEEKENGKVPVVFKAPAGTVRQDVPCGRCTGCRLDYSRGWAMRCMHEASLWENNCFVTLTFDEGHVPLDGNLDVKIFQDFMKRLRKMYGRGVRYFQAGEYGGKNGRPHYHALLFNHRFGDERFVFSRGENRIFVSETLSQLWPFGFHEIGSVTFESAAYVARYCMKKALGKSELVRNDDGSLYKDDCGRRYEVDKLSGMLRVAESCTMSRRPGIGSKWFEKFSSDVFPSDEVIIAGRQNKPPRFYDNLLDKVNPDLMESVRLKRKMNLGSWEERSDARLAVKEEVKKAQIKSLKRELM